MAARIVSNAQEIIYAPLTQRICQGTVLLHLYLAALGRRNPSLHSVVIPSLYIPPQSPFSELEHFIAESVKAYNLDLYNCAPPPPESSSEQAMAVESVTRPSTPRANGARPVGKALGGEGMRRALEVYKSRFPHIEAILIGTRRGDPHGGACFCYDLICVEG